MDVATPGFFIFGPIRLPTAETLCTIEWVDRADWAAWARVDEWRRRCNHAAETCCPAAIRLFGRTPTHLPRLPVSDTIDTCRPEQVQGEEKQRKTDDGANAASEIPATRNVCEIAPVSDVPVGLLCAVCALSRAHVDHVTAPSTAATSAARLRILVW